MELRPIISALNRSKTGAALITCQIAITLAILANAFFVIAQRLELTTRPSGVDEKNIFVIVNDRLKARADGGSSVKADLAVLRGLPGVQNAYASNTAPLWGGGTGFAFTLHPGQKQDVVLASVYFGDERTVNTLGLKLMAGHNVTDVVEWRDVTDKPPISGILVTKAMADQLTPGGDVVGKVVTILNTNQTAPIVGVVRQLQGPFVTAKGIFGSFEDSSVIVPYLPVSDLCLYVVRAQSNRVSALMKLAQDRLYAVDGARLISGVHSLPELRREAYREYRGLAIMLGAVCLILLAVSAFGIIGLTSYWVSRRRRQIGIRRALGATRVAIMRYFMTENLIITITGTILGSGIAVAGNVWMVESFSMTRLPRQYLVLGAIAMLVLGQLAVLWPALRAASVPPALATRNV